MPKAANKILELSQAKELRDRLKAEGKKVVFTNGCFDLLHVGHVDYLEKARELGDFLFVGLNSDLSVSSIKGPSRPVANELSRSRVMASLQFVDGVVVFGEDTPLELIKTLLPDVLVKGNDYAVKDIVGGKEVIAAGGEVQTISLVDGYSTSNLISRINKT